MLASIHENDVTLIHELLNDYTAALMAGDIEHWISIWVRKGIELSSAGQVLSGIGQLRKANQPVLNLFDIEMVIFPEKVFVRGDWAYTYGPYRYAATPKEGGESISNSGLFLTILEKQTGGSWKIAIACFNIRQQPKSFSINF